MTWTLLTLSALLHNIITIHDISHYITITILHHGSFKFYPSNVPSVSAYDYMGAVLYYQISVH